MNILKIIVGNDGNAKMKLTQYEAQNKEILNFKHEYDDYCQWKKTAGKNNYLRTYCREKGISVKDMIAWLRVNKPNKK